MDYIAINSQSEILFDLRNEARLNMFLSNGVTAEDIENNVITEFASDNGVIAYVTSVGFDSGKYWNGSAWAVRPTSVWAVFATEADLQNSFTPISESLDGLRYILTPTSDEYVYVGVGKHTGASGANIPAIELTQVEVAILQDSPKFNTNTLAGGLFAQSDINFCALVLQDFKIALLKANGTFTEQTDALTLLKPVLDKLIACAPLVANVTLATITPAGLFTSQMKTDATALMTAYLNKFPR